MAVKSYYDCLQILNVKIYEMLYAAKYPNKELKVVEICINNFKKYIMFFQLSYMISITVGKTLEYTLLNLGVLLLIQNRKRTLHWVTTNRNGY